MAKAITQRIVLEGQDEVTRALREIGDAGEKMFDQIKRAADKLSDEDLKGKLTRFGAAGQQAFQAFRGEIEKTEGAMASLGNEANKAQSIFSGMDLSKLIGAGAVGGFVGATLEGVLDKFLKTLLEFLPNARKAADEINKIGDASDRFNIPIDKLQRLQIAAEKAGLSAEDLNNILGRLHTQSIQAANGVEQSANTVHKFGDSTVRIIRDTAAARQELQGLGAQTKVIGQSITETTTALDGSRVSVVRFGVDTSQFGEKIKNAADEFKALGLNAAQFAKLPLQDQIVGMAKAMQRVDEETQKVVGLKIFGEKNLNAGLEYFKMLAKGGDTVEEISDALGTLKGKIGFILTPTPTVLEQLGIDAKKFAALNADQKLQAVAEALGKVRDADRQAALASELFGDTQKRSSQQALEAVQEFNETVRKKAPPMITPEQKAAAEEYRAAIEDLDREVKQLQIDMGSDVMGTGFVNFRKDAIRDLRTLVIPAVKEFAAELQEALKPREQEGVFDWFIRQLDQAKRAGENLQESLDKKLKDWAFGKGETGGAFQWLVDAFKKADDEIGKIIEERRKTTGQSQIDIGGGRELREPQIKSRIDEIGESLLAVGGIAKTAQDRIAETFQEIGDGSQIAQARINESFQALDDGSIKVSRHLIDINKSASFRDLGQQVDDFNSDVSKTLDAVQPLIEEFQKAGKAGKQAFDPSSMEEFSARARDISFEDQSDQMDSIKDATDEAKTSIEDLNTTVQDLASALGEIQATGLEGLRDACESLETCLASLSDKLQQVFLSLNGLQPNSLQVINDAGQTVQSTIGKLKDSVQQLVSSLTALPQDALQLLSSVIERIISSLSTLSGTSNPFQFLADAAQAAQAPLSDLSDKIEQIVSKLGELGENDPFRKLIDSAQEAADEIVRIFEDAAEKAKQALDDIKVSPPGDDEFSSAKRNAQEFGDAAEAAGTKTRDLNENTTDLRVAVHGVNIAVKTASKSLKEMEFRPQQVSGLSALSPEKIQAVSEAANSAKDAFAALANSAQQLGPALSGLQSDQMRAIGDAAKTAQESISNLVDKVQQLEPALSGLQSGQMQAIGDAAKAAQEAIGSLVDKVQELISTLSGFQSSSFQSLAQDASSAQSAIDSLNNSLTNLVQSLDQAKFACDSLDTCLRDLSFNSTTAQTNLQNINNVATTLQSAFTTLATTIQQISSALTGMQIGPIQFMADAANNAQSAFSTLSSLIQQVGSSLSGLQAGQIDVIASSANNAQSALNSLANVIQQVISALSGLGSAASSAGSEVSSAVSEMSSSVDEAVGEVEALAAAWDQVAASAQNAAAAAAAAAQGAGAPAVGGGGGGGGGGGEEGGGFAVGGLLRGPGTGRSDSIPIWVSTGEYIEPAHVVSKPGVLPFLEMLRRFNGDLGRTLRSARGFQMGGLIEGISRGLQLSPPMVQAFADGGFVGPRAVFHLHLDNGKTVRAFAPGRSVNDLMNYAALEQLSSGGRKPGRYGRS